MNRMSGVERSPVVLVVDDHEDTRQMSLLVLRSQGFSAMAACGTEAVRQRARAEGVAAFFFKPCSPDVLAAELRRLVSARAPSAV